MNPKDAENELIAKLHARDADGLAAAYDRYGRLAYSLVRSAQSRFKPNGRPIQQTDQLRFRIKPNDPVSILDSAKQSEMRFRSLRRIRSGFWRWRISKISLSPR
jgi:hypothetical protein